MTTSTAPSAPAWWPAVPILCLAGVLYLHAFGDAPIYLGGDEARFATAAHAIASTGRDLNGDRLPLFFHMTDSQAANDGSTRWYQPVLFYLIALVLKVLPLTESSVRIPTALVGLLDVMLMYVVARRLFQSAFYATLAALSLALTPAHLIFSRQALDYICVLPFVLGWLACLTASLESGSVRLSLAAGLLLGLGFYSYIAAWLMTPMCLLLTWAVQRGSHPRARLASLAAGVGFALPLLMFAPWLWSHPDMLRDTIGRYNVYDVRHLSPVQGVKDFFNYNNVQERVSVYWDYFNPAYLFFAGGSNPTTATRRAGVFLAPVGAFLVLGIYDLWQRRSSAASIVLLAGLALSPVPATLVDERYAIQRALLVLPFGVLISVFGIAFLLRQPRGTVRAATVVLLLAMPVQYASFYRDYFTDYRVRSAWWFDPIDFRDVAEYLISADSSARLPAVYLSRDLDDVAPRWRFYLTKLDHEELARRTTYFSADVLDASQVPAGSLLVLYANDPHVPGLLAADACSVARLVVDAAGEKSAVVLRKS